MKIITIANHKGGVGKTTTAINLGVAISQQFNKRVLLIDLDAQANLTQSIGVLQHEQTIYGALRGVHELPQIKITENIKLTPSELDLSGAEIELTQVIGREFILRDLLTPLKNLYDYVIIDPPPSLGLLTTNALTCSDYVIIPVQSEFLALTGLNKLTQVIELVKQKLNPGLTVAGVLLTRFDSRKVLNKQVEQTLRKDYKGNVFKTVIRENIAIAEAPIRGKDVINYAPESNGATDYLSLAKEFLEQTQKTQKTQ